MKKMYTLQKSQHSLLKNDYSKRFLIHYVVIFEEYTFFSHDAPAFEETETEKKGQFAFCIEWRKKRIFVLKHVTQI